MKNEENKEQLYSPSVNEAQLTFRAVITGCLIGGIVTTMNIAIGLKIGWSFGGSIIAAILGFALFKVISPNRSFSILETNIAQTAGSGAGSMASAAGLLAPIPALQLMGEEISWWALVLWSLSIAFLGVMFAVPLKRQFVDEEKLRFPTGLATANTIVSMFADGQLAMKKARTLLFFAVGGLVFCFLAFFIEGADHPDLATWSGSILLTSLASWGFSVYFSPMLFSAGFLVGNRVAFSIMAGSIVGWTLGYYAQQQGWAPHESPMKLHDMSTNSWGAKGWILWPGVAIMVAEALTSLALSWKTFVKAIQGTKSAISNKTKIGETEIPTIWWTGGLTAASILTITVAYLQFDIPVYMTIIAILLSFILANVGVRSTGETDINPVGGMGKVTQGVFGAISTSAITNLMAAGVTGAGASQAADMMQDLKTGKMLGASPRQQFKAQLWGIVAGIIFVIPAYYLMTSAYDLGSEKLPAPAAIAWKAVAEVLSQGFGMLPPMVPEAMIIGALLGIFFALIRRVESLKEYAPSGLAFGLSFLIPAFYTMPIFFGALFLMVWKKINPLSAKELVFAVACGILAGDGVGTLFTAVFTLLELEPLFKL